VPGTVLVLFRRQLFFNFDLAFDKLADTNIVAFLHEHVYRWLYVHTGYLSPRSETLGSATLSFSIRLSTYPPLGAEPLLPLTLIAIVLSQAATSSRICFCGGSMFRRH
jgi:hypothetical protein